MYAQTKREKNEILRAQLEMDRSSFIAQWRDIGDYLLPYRPRFSVTDANRGDRRNLNIIDSTGTFAVRTCSAGMMSGVTSPARPWFRLSTPDPELAEFGPVKEWLHLVSERMVTMFLRSNLYNALPIMYEDLCAFGTSLIFVEEDLDAGIRCYPFPIGSYSIANDNKLRVNTFFREFRMTVRQLVQSFGRRSPRTGAPQWQYFSNHVKTLWDRSEYETWIDVCHVVQPNEEFRPNSLQAKHKRFSSCYYERGYSGAASTNYTTTADSERFLRESGYDLFPALAARWRINGEDVYGTACPGMDAIGDVKQLQFGELRGGEALDKMVRPPMVGPNSLAAHTATILPGKITYVDDSLLQYGFRPAFEVNPRLAELEQKQAQIRDRINRAFYVDLFLMLAQSDRRQITAFEIQERREEKYLALGPVLEQLNQDVLDPLIDLGFEALNRQGNIPPPPPELEGTPLKVEYISVMAQAQKALELGGIERFFAFVGQAAQVNPAILDKVDFDQGADVYADRTGLVPGIVRADDAVAEIRAQKAQAARAQAMAEAAQMGAGAAKDLSQTDMGGDNALTRLLEQGGAGAAVAVN